MLRGLEGAGCCIFETWGQVRAFSCPRFTSICGVGYLVENFAAALLVSATGAFARRAAASKLGNAIADENETYLNNAAEQHQEVIRRALHMQHAPVRAFRDGRALSPWRRRQDENLDGLSAGLSRLKVMAGTISDELDDQASSTSVAAAFCGQASAVVVCQVAGQAGDKPLTTFICRAEQDARSAGGGCG